MAVSEFARQVKALTKKNLILLVTRHWLSTLLQSVIAPIVILSLTLNIRNFGRSSDRYGVGTPRPVRGLADAIPSSQQLVFVKDPSLGADIDAVISTVSRPLAPGKVVQFATPQEAAFHCAPDFRGTSRCYAVVTFKDSPETPPSLGLNQTWHYALRFDPVRDTYIGNVHSSTSPHQIYQLPTKLAIDNAITGSAEVPEEYSFTSMRPEEAHRLAEQAYHEQVIAVYVIVFFLSVLPPVYHAVGAVSGERASGLAALIDAMGGGPAVRVVSWIAALAAVQLPWWIVAGCLYWYLLLHQSNAAIPIIWQILSGLSFLSASVFAASFFRRSIISSLFVCACMICLGEGAAMLLPHAVQDSSVIALSLLFPSMNYIFVLSHMARFARVLMPVDMTMTEVPLPENDIRLEQTYFIAVWVYWVLLIVQILAYPALAILAERLLHGINFRGRTLSETEGDDDDAIRVTGLTKVYKASWFRRIFLCGLGRRDHKALDGLDLVARRNQILCLLGANGAGKSTALDLLAGVHAPTAGQILIRARASKLGVCPQKNVFFSRLTVLEHVRFWSELKGGGEDSQALHELIAACDLTKKTHSRAGTLSGGQKRKLQLACMFAGGTTVCLMDEVTSGMDPVSRRIIWNIILAERSKRSMVFTTHHLDEGEVLADHIAILSRGQLRCQGTGAELKNQLGCGYRVSIPLDADLTAVGLDIPRAVHQDRIVYRTPDSRSAARLVAKFEAAGQSDVQVSGPTIEDVFLRVAQDDLPAAVADSDGLKPAAKAAPIGDSDTLYDAEKAQTAGSAAEALALELEPLSSARPTSFARQLGALLLKRLQILPRYWHAALLALALPIACMPPINTFIKEGFVPPGCLGWDAGRVWSHPVRVWNINFPFGPPSANETLRRVIDEFPTILDPMMREYYADGGIYNWRLVGGYDEFRATVAPLVGSPGSQIALYMGDSEDGGHPPTLAFVPGSSNSLEIMHLYTTVRSRTVIETESESLSSQVTMAYMLDGGWLYILYAAVIFAVYPCFFALYPAYERVSKVRALQISNGVRPLPLYAAYFLFDLCFVLAVSIAYTVTISIQFPYFYGAAYMFPIAFFYGITGILLSYIVSTWATSQLASFLWVLGFSVLGYFGMALSVVLPTVVTDPLDVQRTSDIIAFTIGLVFPIGNVFRGMAIGLNLYQMACRGTSLVEAGSWWGYGFPITYLCIEIVLLAALLVWLDKDLSFSDLFGRRSLPPAPTAPEDPNDQQPPSTSGPEELLQISNLSKSFKSHPAVSSVSLSLSSNEILALLGPNGAGKTTIVNLIRGELRPDAGDVRLRGVSLVGNPSLAQTSIGLCPQFDALDLLTARQHLDFYARIKGVPARDVVSVMARVGLADDRNNNTAGDMDKDKDKDNNDDVWRANMADKLASRLSGGNRRKLSLAIALLGNPAVLVLDEPSSGMDAAAKRRIWRVLSETVAPGRTILLTTHSMEEADALATRAAILGEGRLLALGTTQVLRNEYSDFVCVQLVLREGGRERMVEDWIRATLGKQGAGGAVVFEGVSLGGLVKFMVPASLSEDGSEGGSRSGVGRLIELLEENREMLGLQDYSLGGATLEKVFLEVVKDNYVEEEEVRRRGWKRLVSRR